MVFRLEEATKTGKNNREGQYTEAIKGLTIQREQFEILFTRIGRVGEYKYKMKQRIY